MTNGTEVLFKAGDFQTLTSYGDALKRRGAFLAVGIKTEIFKFDFEANDWRHYLTDFPQY